MKSASSPHSAAPHAIHQRAAWLLEREETVEMAFTGLPSAFYRFSGGTLGAHGEMGDANAQSPEERSSPGLSDRNKKRRTPRAHTARLSLTAMTAHLRAATTANLLPSGLSPSALESHQIRRHNVASRGLRPKAITAGREFHPAPKVPVHLHPLYCKFVSPCKAAALSRTPRSPTTSTTQPSRLPPARTGCERRPRSRVSQAHRRPIL